jgi:hypothetical protein
MEALEGQRSKGLQTPCMKAQQFPLTGENEIRTLSDIILSKFALLSRMNARRSGLVPLGRVCLALTDCFTEPHSDTLLANATSLQYESKCNVNLN